MKDKIRLLFTWRFIRFCVVGACGVVVNMGMLALLADVARVQTNLAAAIAIEVSILTNFLIHEYWTFKDRRAESGAIGSRLLQFHLVSFGGGVIQWGFFVAFNVVFAAIASGQGLAAGGGDWMRSYLIDPILHPPEVGYLKYLSQMIGIGVATFWNFFANFFWTWRVAKEEQR